MQRTNRKQQAAELRSTWLVHEPRDMDGNRHTRRARVVQAIRDARRKPGELRVGDRVVHVESRYLGDVGTIIDRGLDGAWIVKWDDPRSSVTSFPKRLLMRVQAVSAPAAEMPESRAGSQEPACDRASPSAADSEVA